MKDSILWNEESDNYTRRARQSQSDLYAHYDMFAVTRCAELISKFKFNPKAILDVGCAYGGFIHHLSRLLPQAHFYGVDPGKESIACARQNVTGSNITFSQGHAHELPNETASVDLVILNMVLQWIPRGYFIRTLAEIDRVLKPNGVLFVQEFSPDIPKYSVSAHNREVFVFKNDYSKLFTAFPWYTQLHSELIGEEHGEDHRKVIFLLKKLTNEEAYTLKVW